MIMNLREKLLNEEMEFPKWFSNYEVKEYGIIYYNESEKESHDSNHAVLYPEKVSDLEKALIEIKELYMSKGITPRIYHPFKNNYFSDNKAVFDKCGYTVQMYNNYRFMLLKNRNTIIPHSVSATITRNKAKWAQGYICKPSQYIGSQNSVFYPDNKEISDYECEFIRETQLSDGSWSIPWGWSDYPEQWAISKNWWKANGIIQNLLYLKWLGRI